MPVTVVVGGQYGSEGKGKAIALLASQTEEPWVVRCGGPNSGHTVTIRGKEVILRQVPCSTTPETGMFCIGAGCVVDVDLLLSELTLLKIDRDRIVVDPMAVILTVDDQHFENENLSEIASTCSGTGAALIKRMTRQTAVPLVASSVRLKERCRVEPVAPLLHQAIEQSKDVFIEGTQGFSLSLLHGAQYPFVTSRDTTAAAFAAEVGLSPRLIDRIVMVLRTYPIRVGGPSGPFDREISWEEIQARSKAPVAQPEFTSVTQTSAPRS